MKPIFAGLSDAGMATNIPPHNLGEVVDASPYADGLTLSNVMAKEEAEQLLAEADDYF